MILRDSLGQQRIVMDAYGIPSIVFFDPDGRRQIEITADTRISPTSLSIGPGARSRHQAPGIVLYDPDDRVQAEVAIVGSTVRVRVMSPDGSRDIQPDR